MALDSMAPSFLRRAPTQEKPTRTPAQEPERCISPDELARLQQYLDHFQHVETMYAGPRRPPSMVERPGRLPESFLQEMERSINMEPLEHLKGILQHMRYGDMMQFARELQVILKEQPAMEFHALLFKWATTPRVIIDNPNVQEDRNVRPKTVDGTGQS